MDEKIKKYLEDILNAISEIEIALNERGKNYNIFLEDFVFRKFIERNIEIIGEATNRILKIKPDIQISSSRKIVDTRNYITDMLSEQACKSTYCPTKVAIAPLWWG